MDALQAGDEAQIRSGGAVMTVAEVKDGSALCIWQVSGQTKREWFPLAVLKKFKHFAPMVVGADFNPYDGER